MERAAPEAAGMQRREALRAALRACGSLTCLRAALPAVSRLAVVPHWAGAGLGAAVALPLGGCGFKLRGATALGFSRLQLVGVTPQTPLGQELRRQLGGRVQLLEPPAPVQVVLRVESAQREKIVTGLTSSGLVRELVLRLRVRFSLATAQGRLLIEPLDLILQRDLSTNEGAALAKAREEEEIFRVLERDVVLQMIRRLEAVVLPEESPNGATTPAMPGAGRSSSQSPAVVPVVRVAPAQGPGAP